MRNAKPHLAIAATASGEDFFCGAAGQFAGEFRPEQDIRNCRCFFRADGVVERSVEPTKLFVGLDLYSTTSFRADCFFFFVTRGHG